MRGRSDEEHDTRRRERRRAPGEESDDEHQAKRATTSMASGEESDDEHAHHAIDFEAVKQRRERQRLICSDDQAWNRTRKVSASRKEPSATEPWTIARVIVNYL